MDLQIEFDISSNLHHCDVKWQEIGLLCCSHLLLQVPFPFSSKRLGFEKPWTRTS